LRRRSSPYGFAIDSLAADHRQNKSTLLKNML
jgi:hypothetical protein